MGALSLGHILLVAVVVLLLFGTRRLPGMMKDFAKGYRAFMDGLKEDKETPPPPPASHKEKDESSRL